MITVAALFPAIVDAGFRVARNPSDGRLSLLYATSDSSMFIHSTFLDRKPFRAALAANLACVDFHVQSSLTFASPSFTHLDR